MMPAAKMMDPVMGIDIHIIQPPGPVPPLPVPHPFVGMLFDPMELAPIVGASVFVNGMPKATAGSEGKAVPPHIPIGGMFVPPPPGNECEMFMGSSTVLFEGEPASYTALPALSCQSVGMPAPFRPKKKPKPILKLPTSVVFPIPAGPPVLIGGPPTISLTVLGMKVLMGALGKAAKKLKKMMKASKKVKKVSDKIHKAAKKAMNKLGVPPSVQNKVHKAICTVTGHPVDVATGKVFTDVVDFEIEGPIPLRWERTWYSSSAYRGPLGHGWHHAYDMALAEDVNVVAVRLEDGRPRGFKALKTGEEYFDRQEKLTLRRDDAGYSLLRGDGLAYRFAARPGPSGTFPLQAIEDLHGNSLRFAYDPAGRLAQIQDMGGNLYRFVHDDMGRMVRITGPRPDQDGDMVLATYAYGLHGDLVDARDAQGALWSYEYRDHLLVKETDRNGLSFHFEYVGQGTESRCIHTWGDGGIYDHRIRYDMAAGITEVVNSLGNKAVFHHKDGLVYKAVNALGLAATTESNEFTEVVGSSDPLGRTSSTVRDARGNPVEVIDDDGSSMAFAYDGAGRPVEAVDSLGAKWTWAYDADGRLLEKVDPLGRRFAYAYEAGKLVAVTDPAGGVTRLEYHPHGMLAAMTLPDGFRQAWEYDRQYRCVRAVDEAGNVQSRAFDAAGRLAKVSDADGTAREFSYDPEGNLTGYKDNHRIVHFTYAGMGRPATRTEQGTTVRFEYDTEERLTALVNPQGDAYRFALDATGALLEETGFDGVVRRYTRDAAGRAVRIDFASVRHVEIKYDAGDRIVERKHSDGTVEAYAYRADGEMLAAANAHGKLAWERNLLGDILKEAQGDDWVAYGYDALGLKDKVLSSKGHEQRIRRSAVGDVLSLKAGKAGFAESGGPAFAAEFRYDPLGAELERSLPGGVRARWERDSLGRPLRLDIRAKGALVRSRQYVWEPNDRLKSIIDSLRGPLEFHHDAFANLSAAVYEDASADLRMPDALGNIFRDEHRTDRKYGPGGRLLEAEGPEGVTRYEYDPEGNLVRKTAPKGKVWAYAWDSNGMLAKVTRPDGLEVAFAYDALGRRIRKTFRGKVRRWIWDGDMPLHEWEEEDPDFAPAPVPATREAAGGASASGAALWPQVPQGPPAFEGTSEAPVTWIFEPDGHAPLAKLVGGKEFGIVSDHLGAPIAMFDAEGREVWGAELGAYGTLRHLKGDRLACPFRWPGQYEDAETGLYYNRFRYYDPEAGLYISQDPLGLEASVNFYGYVDDPTLFVDIFGLAKGGPYGRIRRTNSKGEVNHIPPNSVSPLPKSAGPSVYMTKADHRKTKSWGSSNAAKAHRKQQKALMKQGKAGFAAAMELDLKDMQKFGDKYKKGMEEMIDYAASKGHITDADAKKLKKKYCS